MVGLVLGLGFQWWPQLHEPWQYLAFIFVYVDIIDYWIDYSPSLKKWPPKREIDVFLDVTIMFSLFLYIYATQLTITYFLGAFILMKFLDYLWLLSSKIEYRPTGTDKIFIDTWLNLNLVEIVSSLIIMSLAYYSPLSPLLLLAVYIFTRIVVRVWASFNYKKIHFS